MSHPDPTFDPIDPHHSEDDERSPVVRRNRKAEMARKLFRLHGDQMKTILDSIKGGKNKKAHPFKSFREIERGHGGDLSPGRHDRDNE